MEDWMRLGNEARDKQDYEAAIEYYKKAADAGITDAWYELKGIYHGYGKKFKKVRDFAKAKEAEQKWYEARLADGDESVHLMLGYIYEENGEYLKAIVHYENAAKNANDNEEQNSAEKSLGAIYYEGKGVPQDFSTALQWYEKAACHGNNMAMIRLGFMYHDGEGTEPNLEKAIEWCQKVSASGLKEGANLLLEKWVRPESVN